MLLVAIAFAAHTSRTACAAEGDAQPPAKAPAAAEPDAAPEPEPEPIEVSVREAPRPPDATTFTRAEARAMPGAFGDPFRVIESAPGVVPLVSGVPYFYVRGAPPGDIGYTLDGIRVPLLFHLGLGPSVIHPALIDSVELQPGPTPETGRYAGGVVAGTLTAPRETLRVEGNIRAVDTGAFLEVPFDDGKADVLAAGRVSYTALLFSLLNASTVLNYWDYAGRASYEIAPGHRLGVFGFGAYDYLAEKQETGPDVLLVDTMFHRVNVFYDVDVSPRTKLEHDVILGWDETRFDDARETIDKSLVLRTTVRHKLDDDVELATGLDVTFDHFDVDLDRGDDEGFVSFFTTRTDIASGAFVVMPISIGERFSMRPGLRADVFVSGREAALAVDPSLSTKLEIVPGLALEATNGLASQPPSFIVAGPGFRPGLDKGGLQRSFTSSVGLEWRPDRVWQLSATGYRLAFFDINDALGTSGLTGEGFPGGFDSFDQRFNGTSTGLELSVRRRLSRSLGAMITYGLGRSERVDAHGRRFPSGFDRTHVATCAITYDFGRGWKAGTRQILYSGAPLLNVTANQITVRDRLPPFYRLDWRLEKKWSIGKTGFVTLVAEVLNTFLAKEVIGESCDERSGVTSCAPDTLGPVTIPSLGVEGGY